MDAYLFILFRPKNDEDEDDDMVLCWLVSDQMRWCSDGLMTGWVSISIILLIDMWGHASHVISLTDTQIIKNTIIYVPDLHTTVIIVLLCIFYSYSWGTLQIEQQWLVELFSFYGLEYRNYRLLLPWARFLQ